MPRLEESIVAWKTCPNCGTEAPISAFRCKQCMHEYGHKQGRNWGPIVLLAVFASMTLVAGGVFFVASTRALGYSSVVDAETQQIRFVTQYASGPVTENVRFEKVAKIVHEHMKNGEYEMYVVTLDGEKKLLSHDKEPMMMEVNRYGEMMKKPIETIDETPAP